MQFEVRALKGGEGVIAMTLDAADEANALIQARAQGLTVLSARPKRAVRGLSFGRSTRFPLMLFSQELLALLSAGLALIEVLETMAEKESRPEARKVFEALRTSLYEGRSFSQALDQFPEIFPKLYVATVRASERTGDLPEALQRFIGYQERIDLVRKKVVSASIYPAVLLVVGGLVTLFLMVYVVPRFAGIYADGGRSLPFLSRLLIEWGQFLNTHGMLAFGVFAGILAALVVLFTQGRGLLINLARKIPAVGERMLVYQIARFYRTVGMLLRGGTPLVTALQMVSGLLAPDLRERLARATQLIREGSSISSAMDSARLTTPVAARMLRVGEKSGDMPEMMDRIAVFHDDELARWIDWFTKLFEPLLMAFIGVVIGAIVVLMYLPIFELAGSMQ